MRRVLLAVVAGLFLAGPAWSQDPCPTDIEIPFSLAPARPVCPGPVTLMAAACGPCTQFRGWTREPGGPIRIHVEMQRYCPFRACTRETLAVPVGTLLAGHHALVVEVVGTIVQPDSVGGIDSCTTRYQRRVEFDVPRTCEPRPGPFPYTDSIRVGPPLCSWQPIPFRIAGKFPNTCYEFKGLELRQPPFGDPLPHPPTVRVNVSLDDCPNRSCAEMLVPWQADTTLPGLPSGNYYLNVEMAVNGVCDSILDLEVPYATYVPFTVAANCSTPTSPRCFLYQWRPGPGDSASCNARVAPGTPGRLILELVPFEPLAGLQARMVLSSPALRVTGVRAIGAAAEMRLAWRELRDGASFVLYSENGTAISCPDVSECRPVPALEVTVSPREGHAIPKLSDLDLVEVLATDRRGHEVPLCPTRPMCPACAPIGPARICTGPSCDFSGDGRVDVRDLILMVRCGFGPKICLPVPGISYDCDRDGTVDLDDVLCCARVILYGRMPDTTASRPAPDLELRVGTPVVRASGVDVPVRVHRADLVGAARLKFGYPSSRFDGAEVEVLGSSSDWLPVSQTSAGELLVGLIATVPAEQMAAGDLDLVLHFSLAAGQQASSDIRLLESEFAGPDGARLVTGAPPGQTPSIQLALSAARPNPFARETRFALTASHATQADLGIFDLTGRRVATLHRGALEAGEHAFRWDGTTGDGARVGDGVYFYRAQASGSVVSRKLVLLRGQ